MTGQAELTIVVRRIIRASRERLFEAWTTPSQLKAWWGPRGVRCTSAEIDARVGGRYRIGNELPDGRVVFLVGEFLTIDRPRQLVFTWAIEPVGSSQERVTVRFEPRGGDTEVIVIHETVPDAKAADSHEDGWNGCLDGLAAHTEDPAGR